MRRSGPARRSRQRVTVRIAGSPTARNSGPDSVVRRFCCGGRLDQASVDVFGATYEFTLEQEDAATLLLLMGQQAAVGAELQLWILPVVPHPYPTR